MLDNIQKNEKLKEILKDQRTVKIIISLLILLILFKLIDFNLLLSGLKNINSLFILVLVLIPINILLRAWRLMIILNQNEKLISIKDSFYLNLVGITMNLFLPASSGDIAKSYYGYKWHGVKEEMLSSNIFDKFMALFSVFIIGSLAAIFLGLYVLSVFSALISLLFILIFFYPKLMPWKTLNKLLFRITKIKLNEEKLIQSFDVPNKIKFKTFIISIIGCFLLYFQLYILILSFSVKISFIYVLAVSPLMNLASLFPFTFNGLGSGEALVIYLFGIVNVPPTMSLLISLLCQVLNAIIPGFFGYLIIMRK